MTAVYAERNANQSMLADAEREAKDDSSTLVYIVQWDGVTHRYGALAHIMNVLQINPEKEIVVMYNTTSTTDSDTGKTTTSGSGLQSFMVQPLIDAKNTDGTRQYPNVSMVYAPATNINTNYADADSSQFKSATQLAQVIADIKGEGKVADVYIDDFHLARSVTRYGTADKGADVNKAVVSTYGVLALARSVNQICDGNGAFGFFDDTHWKSLQAAGFSYDPESRSWPEADKVRQELADAYAKNGQSGFADAFISQYASEQPGKNPALAALWSLMAASHADANGVSPARYFVPGTDTIIDLNSHQEGSSSTLMAPEMVPSAGWWDPYFSVDADFMGLYAGLTEDSKLLVVNSVSGKSLAAADLNPSVMDGHDNILYSGMLMSDGLFNQTCTEPALVAKLFSEVYDPTAGNAADGQPEQLFWYKMHPREGKTQAEFTAEVDKQSAAMNLNLPPAATWLKYLDQAVPIEMWLLQGFGSSEAASGRTVKYYSGFSTSAYVLRADKAEQSFAPAAYLFSQGVMKQFVNVWNGYPSLTFPDGQIRITDDILAGTGYIADYTQLSA